MYCVFCGAENPEFASFCEKCGKGVRWKQNQPSTEAKGSPAPSEAESRRPVPSQFVPAEEKNDETAKDVPRPRKYRRLWIPAWFLALLTINAWSHWSQNADKNALYIFLEALERLTSPLEISLSAAVVGGILLSGKAQSRDGEVQTLKKGRFSKRAYILAGTVALVGVIGLVVASLPRGGTKQAADRAAQSKQQDEKATVNPNALDNYEIMSKSKVDVGTVADGLAPEAKKRMREMLALQLAGGLQQQNNPIHVEVTGDSHDVLLFQLPSMSDAVSNELIQRFRGGDANFWNAMRLMNYRQVVFSGESYKKIVTREEFLRYGKDYEKYKAAFLIVTKGLQSGAQGELTKP